MSNERRIAENKIRAHFVPEEGISLEALEANLKNYFGAGAKIAQKLRLDDGEVGWLIDGGRVSPAIINTLREETQRRDKDVGRRQRAAVPVVPSSRHDTNTTVDPARTPNDTGRSVPSPISRHTIEQAHEQSRTPSRFDRLQRPPDRRSETIASPSRPHVPTRMLSFLPPDPMEPYSPASQGRYPPTDVVDVPPRENRHVEAATSIGRNSQSSLTTRHDKSSTSNTDPAYAARHPEINFTQEDFDTFMEFKRYLGLKQMREQQPLSQNASECRDRPRRHQDQGLYIGDPPPAYQSEDAASRPRRLDSLRGSRGRDDDEDEDPDYGQQSVPQSIRHARERGADAGMHTRNFVRDEDDEDPDATPDYGLTTATTNPDRVRHHQDSSTKDRHSKPSSRRSGNKDKDKGRGPGR